MRSEISAAAQTMRADAQAMVGADADTAPLLGTWVNARRNTMNIAKFVVTERGGAMFVQAYGVSDDGLVDWGETEAIPYMPAGTTEAGGFHAWYELNTTKVEIATYVTFGLTVVEAYSSFHDDSDRLNQFSRELFYLSTAEPVLGDVQVGLSFLAGEWVNVMPNTEWVKEISLTGNENGYRLRMFGANEPIDWGETEAVTFLAGNNMPAFHAHYDLGSVEVLLAANVARGLVLVVEGFHQSRGDESANAFWREFFVPRYRPDS